ncbi:hypothetical protein [Sulfitobacter sp. R18_1]|uniref:hypothetical protein n=1 Tax=Sulfitobacter sp. R18_1 TaxID=2821104 RepID=UPI001ADA5744|nr:hypothetical protein [Sulfitobacter sp. R18_1]MBO9428203.1 hypothetical protein [Sulfitobacter sp. R18_1]
MSYGDKLKEIHKIYEEAGVTPSAKYSPDELLAIKDKIELMLESLRAKITVAIDAGEVPTIRMNDSNEMSWMLAADQSKGLYATLWAEEKEWFQSEGLDVALSTKHDVGGMKEWLVVKVTPADPVPVPRM